jgi:hypothetical protein
MKGNVMKCLIKECEGKSISRGLCWNCYNAALRRVGSGKNSWDNFISLGLALPAKHNGRNGSFQNALSDLSVQQSKVEVPNEMLN